jgi:hypothetical protein
MAAGTDAEVGMGWVKNHVQTFSDGFAGVGITGAEYFVLPRSGWAGTWAHSAALWSGDISSDFATFAIQIKVLQQAMLSGVALWTTDIGGYTGGNPADPVFQELIVRWFQFGAFCPLFRLHGHRDGGPPENQCGCVPAPWGVRGARGVRRAPWRRTSQNAHAFSRRPCCRPPPPPPPPPAAPPTATTRCGTWRPSRRTTTPSWR